MTNAVTSPSQARIAFSSADEKARNVATPLTEVEGTKVGNVPHESATAGGLKVIYGLGGIYVHQLLVTETTELLPVVNPKDVCLKCRAGQTIVIWYS